MIPNEVVNGLQDFTISLDVKFESFDSNNIIFSGCTSPSDDIQLQMGYSYQDKAYTVNINGSSYQAHYYNNSVVEDAGLLKMDFLGLKTLTIIKDTVKLIKYKYQKILGYPR